MDFSLSDTQKMLQETARRFARDELPALAREVEKAAEPVPAKWLKRYAELGFLALNTAEELGGAGGSHLDALIVLEEFAKVSAAVAFPVFEAATGPVRIVDRFGSPELRERVVPKVVAGEMIVAISPGGGGFGDPKGRDPQAVAEAVREGWITEARARDVYGVTLKDGNPVP